MSTSPGEGSAPATHQKSARHVEGPRRVLVWFEGGLDSVIYRLLDRGMRPDCDPKGVVVSDSLKQF